MADESIALKFILDADKANLSLGELEKGYDALKEQIKKTDRSTAEGKAAFKELSTQLAETGREVKNIELSFEALDNEQVASELGSVAGAVGDVTASMVLLGGENETMEQMAASIEKAMAISMGFKGAIEGVSSGMKLYNNLLKTGKLQTILYSTATKIAGVATKVFNAILKANPIMLVVTAIIAAVAAYKSLTSETKSATFAQKAYSDASKEATKSTVKEKRELEKLVETAKNENLSKSQRVEAIQKLNELSPEYLGNITLETINTKEAQSALDGYVDSLERKARAQALENKLLEEQQKKIDIELKTADERGNWLSTLIEYSGNVAGAQAHANQTDKESIKITEDKIDAIKKLIKAEDEAIESHNLLNAARSIGIDTDKAAKTAIDNKAAAAKAADDAEKARLEDIKNRKDIELVATKEFNEEMYVEEEAKTFNLMNYVMQLTDAKTEAHEKTMEQIAAEKEARREAIANGLNQAASFTDSLSSMSTSLMNMQIANAGNNEKKIEEIRRKGFERDKKLNMAKAAIAGAQAVMQALAGSPPPMNFILAAGVGTAAAIQIAAISKQKYNGGSAGVTTPSGGLSSASAGGAAAGSGGAQIDAVSNTSTILGDQKVFVTETDITETQNNVNVIEQSATF